MVPEKRDVSYGYSGGKVEFEIPRFRSAVGQWFGRTLRLSDVIGITLDEVGTFIWREIDGAQDVKTIGERLAAEFGDKVDPLYPRLAGFLQSLEKNRFIRYRTTHGTRGSGASKSRGSRSKRR